MLGSFVSLDRVLVMAFTLSRTRAFGFNRSKDLFPPPLPPVKSWTLVARSCRSPDQLRSWRPGVEKIRIGALGEIIRQVTMMESTLAGKLAGTMLKNNELLVPSKMQDHLMVRRPKVKH